MNLPGLNFDESKYPITWKGSLKFREIPFSDWLPPDHVDVICHAKSFSTIAYYSPGSGLMVPSESNRIETRAFEPGELVYWLKEVK
jgi:hypothetical protein